jgi:8-oxo-dGTP diphosphatase
MKPPYHYHVIFRILNFEIDPEAITEAMGISPTCTWLYGDSLAKTSLFHNSNGWEINKGKITEVEVGFEIGELLLLLKEPLTKLRSRYSEVWNNWNLIITVPVYLEDRAPSIIIPSEIMEELGRLNIELDVDLYPMWEAPPPRPRVGVTAMLTHKERLLVGVRKGSHAVGQLAFPGGHQEMLETWGQTAVGETKQETGLDTRVREPKVKDQPFLFVTDTYFPDKGRQYTTVWVSCEPTGDIDVTQRIEPLEPEKCEGWDWLTLDELFQKLLDKEDYNYYDISEQDPDQAVWLPIKRLLYHSTTLGLEWPERLRSCKIPEGFWESGPGWPTFEE